MTTETDPRPSAGTTMPTAFIFRGGGPCFFMQSDPPHEWDGLRACLEGIGPSLAQRPTALGARIAGLLGAAGVCHHVDPERG